MAVDHFSTSYFQIQQKPNKLSASNYGAHRIFPSYSKLTNITRFTFPFYPPNSFIFSNSLLLLSFFWETHGNVTIHGPANTETQPPQEHSRSNPLFRRSNLSRQTRLLRHGQRRILRLRRLLFLPRTLKAHGTCPTLRCRVQCPRVRPLDLQELAQIR